MLKRSLALLLAIVLAFSLVACGGSASSTAASSTATSTPVENSSKPYEGQTLTVWCRLHENYSGMVNNMCETKWYEAIHEATGMNIEYIHPALGEEDTEFSLLVASGDYPDVILYSWTKYPGGATAAINDGVIIPLNEYVDGGKTPNLKTILDANPSIDKAVKTTDGDYYVFPTLRGTTLEDNNCLFSSGFFMRGDILEELNLEVPETIEEWYNVLTAVKAAHPSMIPFMTRTEWMNQIFCPGFDNYWDYYVEDGSVKFGPAEDSHYDYLQEMAKWYKEGLIDPDYLTHTKASDDRTAVGAGQAFASYDACGGFAGTVIPTLIESGLIEDESDIITTVPTTSTKGKNAKFAKMNSPFDASTSSAAITSQCKNIDAALWFLDFMYSEEGHMINNFGIEGESYDMVNGQPVLTDAVTNNPDGLSIAQELAMYTAMFSGTSLAMDPRVNPQYYTYTSQREGMELWTKTDFGTYMFPSGAAIDGNDSDDFATITNNIKTYREENEAAWITGTKALTEESWKQYIAQLEAYGLSRAIGYKQAAYDKYMAN